MKTGGLATAVALAGGVGDLGLEGDGEQVSMFEADAPLPLAPVERGKSGPQGGRPLGRRNTATEEARQYFLSRYRSPLIGLGETYSRRVEDLARELFLTRVVQHLAPGQQAIKEITNKDGSAGGWLVWDLERAFDKQTYAQVAALPYVERKQPIAIDAQGQVAGIILIGDHAGVSDDGDGVLTLDMQAEEAPGVDDAQSVEDQQVSDGANVRHANAQSDAQPKSQKPFGVFKE